MCKQYILGVGATLDEVMVLVDTGAILLEVTGVGATSQVVVGMIVGFAGGGA